MRSLLFSALFILAGCAAGPKAPDLQPRPAFLPERQAISASNPEIDGVWRSRGYGWILEIDSGDVTQYESGDQGCYARPQGAKGQTAMLSLSLSEYRLSQDRQAAMFMYGPDSVGPIFDRLNGLPDVCRAPLDASLAASFDAFIAIFGEHYAHFKDRNADWPALSAQARSIFDQNPTQQGFLDAANEILRTLQDSHTRLIAFTPEGRIRLQHGLGKTLTFIRNNADETEWLVGIIDQLMNVILDPGAKHLAEDRILWGMIDNEIGYLQVFQMGGFAGLDIDDPHWAETELQVMDDVLDEAFEKFSGAKAVILDLTNNRGGYDEIARRLAARFAKTPFHAYDVYAKGENLAPLMKIVDPEADHRFTGPVYLLTSDVTVSGGEISTLSLRQLPNVNQAGQSTRGAFSTPLAKVLPNGWVMELANETFAAPDGEVFAGRGIPPQLPLEVFDESNPIVSHGAAIKTIVQKIREMDSSELTDVTP